MLAAEAAAATHPRRRVLEAAMTTRLRTRSLAPHRRVKDPLWPAVLMEPSYHQYRVRLEDRSWALEQVRQLESVRHERGGHAACVGITANEEYRLVRVVVGDPLEPAKRTSYRRPHAPQCGLVLLGHYQAADERVAELPASNAREEGALLDPLDVHGLRPRLLRLLLRLRDLLRPHLLLRLVRRSCSLWLVGLSGPGGLSRR